MSTSTFSPGWKYYSKSNRWITKRIWADWVSQLNFAFSPSYIWQDLDGNYYYSNRQDQYKLNLNNLEWQPYSWNGIYPVGVDIVRFRYGAFERIDIVWFAGDGNIYKLTDGAWTTYELYDIKSGNKITTTLVGRDWCMGGSYYFNDGTNYNFYAFKDSNSAYVITPTFTRYPLYGRMVYYLGNTYYYSVDNDQYEWQAPQWVVKTWTGFAPLIGGDVWYNRVDRKYHYSYESDQYVYNSSTGVWDAYTWDSTIYPNLGTVKVVDGYLISMYEYDPVTQDAFLLQSV